MAKTTDTNTATAPVEFADTAFKSRTIVLPDGHAFAVEKSRIVANDPALVEYLDKHPEFERVAEE